MKFYSLFSLKKDDFVEVFYFSIEISYFESVMKKSVRVIAPRCLRGDLKKEHDHSSPDPLRWVSSKALYDTPVVSGTDCARTIKQLC